MSRSLHIFIGDSSENTGASGLVQRLARSGAKETWSCVKAARADDRALIYVDSPQSSVVARAKVLKGAKRGRRDDYPYRATLGRFELLANPISLDELKAAFPRWGWLRFPRGKAEVPSQYSKKLWRLAHRRHPNVQILISNSEVGLRRLKAMVADRTSRYWSSPKQTRKGDTVLLYVEEPVSSIVGVGKALSDARPTDSRWHEAKIGRLRMLKAPITLAELRARFPTWRWLHAVNMFAYVSRRRAGILLCRVEAERVSEPRQNKRSSKKRQETGRQAQPLFGEALYQRNARRALPLLVKVAETRSTIYYADLADVLGMPNPRNLNYVLGSVGQTLLQLGGKTIPPIQCLVVNQDQELPGEGVGFFIDKRRFRLMPMEKRRRLVAKVHERIWAYQKWGSVLARLSLRAASNAKMRAMRRKGANQGSGYGDPETNKLVESAAIRHVTGVLRRRGYHVTSREREYLGYDLDASKAGTTTHIEVKGVSGGLIQFLITQGELKRAKADPDFRLNVVTSARTDSPRIHQYRGCELRRLFRLEPTAFRATPGWC